MLEAVVEQIRLDREWKRAGISDRVEPISAHVLSFIPLSAVTGASCHPVQIRFSEPVCRLFTDRHWSASWLMS